MFAAGVMLTASFTSLILPGVEIGDIDGLVTLTDVLEALAGDLTEPLQAPVGRRGDGSWLVDAEGAQSTSWVARTT